MTYTLRFLLEVERDQNNPKLICYDGEKFDKATIRVSVPDVVKIFEPFIESFEEVALVEKPSPKSDGSQKKKGSDRPSDGEQSEKKAIATSSPLMPLSGKAYICQSQKLDEAALNQLCVGLVEYLQDCCSKFSAETFLSQETGVSEETNVCVSGIQEVLNLRNYLTRCINSNNKMYKKGYLYVARD
jgi:hypothetical protein